ncbi:MAG: type II toxin-antitoxin system VapC family toxin [Blastocatellia bacterium]
MKIADALASVRELFLDTAPIIYHVEGNLAYQPLTDQVFQSIQAGTLSAVTSSITLSECLVHPYRRGDMALAQKFRNVITAGVNTRYVGVDAVAERAAEVRARYNLKLADSFQTAAAIAAGCDAFLTNDSALKRVSGITILVLDELEV